MAVKETVNAENKPLWQRLGWLAVIWAGSVVTLGIFAWLMRLFKRKIGGYTGDCLGAVQQFSEVAFYCGLLCKFS